MDSRSFENESKNIEARSDEKFGQCLAKSVGNRRVYWIFGCWVYAPDDKTKTPVNVIARLTEREEPRSKNFSPLRFFFFFHQLSSFEHNALYKIDCFFRIQVFTYEWRASYFCYLNGGRWWKNEPVENGGWRAKLVGKPKWQSMKPFSYRVEFLRCKNIIHLLTENYRRNYRMDKKSLKE